MVSFRGVCTLQQQQVGRTDLELARMCMGLIGRQQFGGSFRGVSGALC